MGDFFGFKVRGLAFGVLLLGFALLRFRTRAYFDSPSNHKRVAAAWGHHILPDLKATQFREFKFVTSTWFRCRFFR